MCYRLRRVDCMLSKLTKMLDTFIGKLAWLGIAMLCAAVLVTVVDVLGRKLLGFSIQGTVEIMQLMVMYAAFTAIPYAFTSRSHVAISLFIDKLPYFWRRLSDLTMFLLAAGFMVAVAYFGALKGLQEWEYGDVTLTLGIPKIYFWFPLVFGSAISTLWLVLRAIENLFGQAGTPTMAKPDSATTIPTIKP